MVGVEIAWDANVDATIGYRVHVGTESAVYEQVFDVGPATSFVYTDGIPGSRYYFAVSAYDADGRESPASDEVSTVVRGVEADPIATVQRCAASVGGDCHDTRVRAGGLEPVRGIAALPDGRVLFVENARHVRLLDATGLVAAASLSVEDPNAALTEVVVDPSFVRTQFVFVGLTELQRDGHRDLRIIRYRLVREALGEGATIVSGLSFHGDQAPRFAVDGSERIYVAMPRVADGGIDPYAGHVLRFAADGSVPEDQRGASPIVADGVAVPLDLDWDGHAVWIVGLDERSQPVLGRLLQDPVRGDWPQRLSGTGFETPPGVAVSAFDVAVSGVAPHSTSRGVVLDTMQRLHRVTTGDAGVSSQVEAMAWSADDRPVDIALGAHGSVHVVVRTPTGSFAIVEMTVW
jgi:hypothetical protein